MGKVERGVYESGFDWSAGSCGDCCVCGAYPCPWRTGVQGDQRLFGTVLRDIGRNISEVYFVQARICAILKGR